MTGMDQPDLSSLAESLRQDSHARFFITDVDGVCRGKSLSGPAMADLLLAGGTVSSAVFGWDIADDLYGPEVTFAGLHTGLGEVGLRLDPLTARTLPWDGQRWLLVGEHVDAQGAPLALCPRQVLKRVLARAAAQGLQLQVGLEFEWFVLCESERSLREKGYRGLHTATQSVQNYSPFRLDALKAFVDDLFTWLPQAGIPIEALHTEAGPGNLEAALHHADALVMADRAVLFKQAVREIGRRHGLLSTFMAKWSAQYGGCGQHVHQSLWRDGRNLFHDPAQPDGSAAALRHYLGGQLQALPELLALYAPQVNSYKRLVDGMLAPVRSNWGLDNRHAALRVVRGGPRSQRLELRVPGADANPYLVLAAAAASGLHGLANGLEPGAAATAADITAERLPRTLAEATERLAHSALAREWLGDDFVTHFVQTRRWEWQRYSQAVTDWELARYLESV
jgi:glutamine synthetase